jgi:hypothetical protein
VLDTYAGLDVDRVMLDVPSVDADTMLPMLDSLADASFGRGNAR